MTVCDTTAAQIIGGECYRDTVTHQNPNPEPGHPARGICQDLMPILQLHPEILIGQDLGHYPLHLNRFLFRHSHTSAGYIPALKESPAPHASGALPRANSYEDGAPAFV
jgi:hypothetical protein